MQTYEPSPELTKAVIAGIATPLPFLAAKAVKHLPGSEMVTSAALKQVIPMSLRAIASTREAGARVALMRHGSLTEDAEQGILRRIASWFTPSEFTDVTSALQRDIVQLAHEGFGEEGWTLEATADDIVLVVLETTFVKVSVDTVADIFMSSFDSLKGFKDKLPYFGRK